MKCADASIFDLVRTGPEAVRAGLLQDPRRLHTRDGQGATPLHLAADAGDAAVVELLLLEGADPNATDAEGDTPLHRAAVEGAVAVGELLVRHGATIDSWANGRTRPLGAAIYAANGPFARYLISAGASIDDVVHDINGQTPLLAALEQGLRELAIELLSRGADVAPRDELDRSALHFAAIAGDAEVCRLLRLRGASTTTQRDRFDKTPLEYAREVLCRARAACDALRWRDDGRTVPSPTARGYSMARVLIDGSDIFDGPTFHRAFARALGFPSFYGANMNAWIDCMSTLDLETGMSSVHLAPGEPLALEIVHATELHDRCPEQLAALVTCTAFVNRRYAEAGSDCRVTLVFM